MSAISDKQMEAVEKQFIVYESLINAMTPEERVKPELLARVPARRRRIARGSGRTEQDVAELLSRFTAIKSQMKTLSSIMGGMMGEFETCSSL
jgi:signal recognition particle subunit SRP54